MSEEVKKHKILRFLLWSSVTLAILLVGLYFFVSSSFFICRVVLPQVGKMIKTPLSAQSAQFSPWRGEIVINKIYFGESPKPLATVEQLSGMILWRSLWNRTVELDQLQIKNAKVYMSVDENGVGNYNFGAKMHDGSEKDGKKNEERQSASSGNGGFNLKAGNIRIIDSYYELKLYNLPDRVFDLSVDKVNMFMANFQNDSPFEMALSGVFALNCTDSVTVEPVKANLTLNGRFNHIFLPQDCRGDLSVEQFKCLVRGESFDVGNNNVKFLTSVQTTGLEIKEFSLQQRLNRQLMSDVNLDGKIDFSPFGIELNLSMHPLSESVCAMLGAAGLNFYPGKIKMDYDGSWKYDPKQISAQGNGRIERHGDIINRNAHFSLPDNTINLEHDFKIDKAKKTFALNKLSVRVDEKTHSTLQLDVKSPAVYCYDEKVHGFIGKIPAIELTVNAFNLALIQLTGAYNRKFVIQNGTVNGSVSGVVNDHLNQMKFNGMLTLENVDFALNNTLYDHIGMKVLFSGDVDNFKELNLHSFIANISREGTLLGQVGSKGSYDFSKNILNYQWDIGYWNWQIVRALPCFQAPDFNLNEFVDTFEPTDFEQTGDVQIDFATNLMQIKQLNGAINRQDGRFLMLTTKPNLLDLDSGKLQHPWDGELRILNVPLKKINRRLQNTSLEFQRGTFNAVWLIRGSEDFGTFGIKGINKFLDVGLQYNNELYENIALTQQVNCEVKDFYFFDFKELRNDLSYNNESAFSGRLSGTFDRRKFEVHAELIIDSLSKPMGDIFKCNILEKLEMKGVLRVDSKAQMQECRFDGYLTVNKFKTIKNRFDLSGQFVTDILWSPAAVQVKRFQGTIDQDAHDLVNLEITGNWPLDEKNTAADFQLKSDELNVDLLLEQFFDMVKFKSNTAPKNNFELLANENKPEFEFKFTRRPVNLDVNMEVISWGENVLADWKAKLNFTENQVVLHNSVLKINNGELQTSGRLVGSHGGNFFTIEAVGKNIELQPLLHPFVREPMEKLSGHVNNMKMTLNGQSLVYPRLFDTLSGQLEANFGRSVIPTGIRYTAVGALIFVPFDIFSKLQSLLPGSGHGINNLDDAVKMCQTIFADHRSLEFESGVIKTRTANGRIIIDEFAFHGDLVRDFTFAGTLGLGSKRELDLNSILNISNIKLPIYIGGVLESPQVNIQNSMTGFLKENAKNILSIINVPAKIKNVNVADIPLQKTFHQVVEAIVPSENANKNI